MYKQKNDLTKFFYFRNSFHKIAANEKLVHILTSTSNTRTKIKYVKISTTVKNISTVQEKITPA